MSSEPVRLDARAADNLRFIRDTMERAGAFTAVPGWGGAAMGASAVVAAFLAAQQSEPASWLRVWLIELVAAVLLAGSTMALKAKNSRVSLFGGPARRFALAFAPPVVAGGILTYALATSQQYELLAGTWLLLYGAGIVAGGVASVRIIPLMGALFFVLGVLAIALPANISRDVLLAVGFGGLHIIFGGIIAWRYGG
ncbi:MAG TPA: hypothetical protein VGD49_03170 [Longimicrobiales bacterium]